MSWRRLGSLLTVSCLCSVRCTGGEEGQAGTPRPTRTARYGLDPPLPVLDVAADPAAMDEADAAAPVEVVAVVSNPLAGAVYTLEIDWRDGSAPDHSGPIIPVAGEEVRFARRHVYLDDRPGGGAYAVLVTARTGAGTTNTAATAVEVANVPPTAFDIEPDPADPGEGLPVTLTGSSGDPSPTDTLTQEWDFKDGDVGCTPFVAEAEGDQAVQVFPDDGIYTVCLRATDDDGGVGEPRAAILEVANLAPVAIAPLDLEDVREGEYFVVDGGGEDVPGDVIAVYQWTLDDCEIVDPPPDRRNGPWLGYRCRDDGLYTGSLQVTDDGGDTSDPAHFLVSVANVRPSVMACVTVDPDLRPPAGTLHHDAFPPDDCDWAGATVLEASEAVFSAAGVDRALQWDADTDTNDVLTYAWDFGDGSRPAFGQQVEHAFDRRRPMYRVSVTARDDDGGERNASLTVTVDNVPPYLPDGPDEVAVEIRTPEEGRVEGSPVWFHGVAHDTAGAQLTYVWEARQADAGEGCNANRRPPEVRAELAGVDRTDVAFTFPDDDCYEVCLHVRDEGGAESRELCRPLVVTNLPPVAEAGWDLVVDEGEPFTLLEGLGTDPGSRDDLTYRWEFGDGEEEPGFHDGPMSEAHAYLDETPPGGCPADGGCTYTVTLHVRDKDGQEGTDSLQVLVRNVAPTLPLLPPVVAVEGVDQEFFPGQGAPFPLCAVDPGAGDTHTYTFSWGDGTEDELLQLAPRDPPAGDGTRCGERMEGRVRVVDRPVTAWHAYALEGSYVPRLCVADDGEPEAGRTCRPFSVRVANDPPRIVGVDDDGEREAEGSRRTDAELDQGIESCRPVLVRDQGVALPDPIHGLNDRQTTGCRLLAGPAGMTIEDLDYGDVPFVFDPEDLQPDEHVPCWFCWWPPESAIDTSTRVRVEVWDGMDADTHEWDVTVALSDADGDGLPNTFEVEHPCLDPSSPPDDEDGRDAGDPDGDGLDNLQEYRRGSNPCASNLPTAPSLSVPPDGGEAGDGVARLSVHNAADADGDRVYAWLDDVRPLRYLFRIVEGVECPDPPDAAACHDACDQEACEGLAEEGAEVTSWVVEGELAEDTDYSWSAWACDGWGFGPAAQGEDGRPCGTFFFSAEDSPPEPPTLLRPEDGAEDLPPHPELVWSCPRLGGDLRVDTGDRDRDPVTFELEIRVRGEGRPFLRHILPPCDAGQETTRYELPAELAADKWYEWTVRSLDDGGYRTDAVVEAGAPAPPWSFLVNADNVEPRAPTLVQPVTVPIPRAGDRLPGITVTEVHTRTPELVFRVQAAPDADDNVVAFVVDAVADGARGLEHPELCGWSDELALVTSEPIPVGPGEEGSWTVTGGGLPEDTFVWWRVRGLDREGPGEAACTLVFANAASAPPQPSASGRQEELDSLRPVLVAERPTDPDGDLISCEFQVVRVADAGAGCPESGGCETPACEVAATSGGRVRREPDGSVGWRPEEPLQNRAPHCWRHRCCDEVSDCGAWSAWLPFAPAAGNQCPRGIRLRYPASDRRLPPEPPPTLAVDNATDPDFGAEVHVRFQVFASPTLDDPDGPLVDVAVPAGAEGETVLDLGAQDPPELAGAYETLLRRGVVGGRTFHWRARASDGDDTCDYEWTAVGRFVLHDEEPTPEGCCGSTITAAPPPGPAPSLGLLLAIAWWLRRRRA